MPRASTTRGSCTHVHPGRIRSGSRRPCCAYRCASVSSKTHTATSFITHTSAMWDLRASHLPPHSVMQSAHDQTRRCSLDSLASASAFASTSSIIAFVISLALRATHAQCPPSFAPFGDICSVNECLSYIVVSCQVTGDRYHSWTHRSLPSVRPFGV